MTSIYTIPELQEHLNSARLAGSSIGLVPTMGALHEGHLSLISAAEKNDDLIVVSIFVNPTQFNNPADLERYPRTLEKDLNMLADKCVDYVFIPSVKEMYPEKDTRTFDLAPLDSVMEGRYRPGHFNGVAQIVSKLFEAVRPHRAYFGQKDFQQLAIIRKLVNILQMNIEIIGCPIVREKDGLAMSSRNQLLSVRQREAAPLIYKTLGKAVRLKDKYTIEEIKQFVESTINQDPQMKLEYFEIVDDQNLTPLSDWTEAVNKVACIAVHLGEIRLIDNIYFD